MATQTTKLVVAPAASHIPALAMDEEELMGVLLSSVYPGAKPASVKLVVNVCRAAGKDPLKKPYHIVPMSVKTGRKKQNGYDETEMRDVIMPGINDYRTDAARTGQHAGTSEPEFGPDVTAKLGEVTITYPQWCKVAVQRRLASGELVTFTAKEFWMENYATQSRDNPAPNAMWKKRPYAQIAKCAEAQALRKGFPEVGNQPTYEEMEGKEIDMGTYDTDGQQTASAKPSASEAKKAKELPPLADEKLDGIIKKFGPAIKAGEFETADVISDLQEKYAMTAEQIARINDCAPVIIEGEAA